MRVGKITCFNIIIITNLEVFVVVFYGRLQSCQVEADRMMPVTAALSHCPYIGFLM